MTIASRELLSSGTTGDSQPWPTITSNQPLAYLYLASTDNVVSKNILFPAGRRRQ